MYTWLEDIIKTDVWSKTEHQSADDMHPFLHLHHIGILPFQKTANQEEIAQHEGIGEEKTQFRRTYSPEVAFLRTLVRRLCLD